MAGCLCMPLEQVAAGQERVDQLAWKAGTQEGEGVIILK